MTRVDTEAVRERRVDLERLARLLHLLLAAPVLGRAHVVEPVGELDQDDPRVVRHRHDHLPVVLGLGLLAALEADPRQLGDALDQVRDVGAELAADVVDRRLGVLDDVVEERGGDRLLVEVELGADLGDAEGCWMKSSPERRCWPSWARAAKWNALLSSSRSASEMYASTSPISSSTRS